MDDQTFSQSIDETARRVFEQRRRDADPVSIEECLPPREDPKYLATVEELVVIDMEFQWKSATDGVDESSPSAPFTENYLRRFPELDRPEVVTRLTEYENRMRQRFGGKPIGDKFDSRFPSFATVDQQLEDLNRLDETTTRFGGRYQIERLHAEGGIGQVWLARDQNIGRQIALKELKHQNDPSGAAAARFTTEAKVTGQLEHPNIVPVYEISETEDESLFYTMRFVRGKTLNEAIKDYHTRFPSGNMLQQSKLLNSFIAACNAVDYAHSQGVLHRDLKGQNIVLGDFGEVFVLDWGLAKLQKTDAKERALDQPTESDANAAATRDGQIIGTPAFMAPEQAAGQVEEIDQRTDVYGLGAILYQILTGKTPFDYDSKKPFLERVIEDVPKRPGEIAKHVPPGLEAICLKAIAKQADERYESVGNLAQDIQRFLVDEKVSAHKERLFQRCARWARKHRTWTQAVVVALIVVATVSLFSNYLINEARNRAEQSRLAAMEAQGKETKERERAEENFRMAREAVDKVLTRFGQGPLADTPHMQQVGQMLLEDALAYYKTFQQQKGNDFQVRLEMGRAERRVADIRRKLGKHQEAQKNYDNSVKKLEELCEAFPKSLDSKLELSMTYANQGHNYQELSKPHDAEDAFEDALDLAKELIQDPSVGQSTLQHLAICHQNMGIFQSENDEPNEAESNYREALRIQQDLLSRQPKNIPLKNQLGKTWNNLGLLLRNMQRSGEAKTAFEKSLAIKRKLVKDHPNVSDYRHDLANSLNHLGILYADRGELGNPKNAYHEAQKIQEILVRDFPSIAEFQSQLGATLHNLAELHLRQREFDAAVEVLKRAIDYQMASLRMNPVNLVHRMFLRNHYWALCDAFVGSTDHRQLSAASTKLPEIIKNWQECKRAAKFQANCLTMLRKESSIPEDERSRLEKTYAELAVSFLKQGIELGLPDRKTLADDPTFYLIRENEEFKKLVKSD